MRYKAEAERLLAAGHYRPAHRMAVAAFDSLTDPTDEQIEWFARIMDELEAVDPVLTEPGIRPVMPEGSE